MHFNRGSPYLEAEMERNIAGHLRASGDPALYSVTASIPSGKQNDVTKR